MEFIDLGPGEALERVRRLAILDAGAPGRADWAANVLLAIPIGYFLLGALTLDSTRRPLKLLAAVAVSGMCTIFAVGLEFAQLWVPDRTSSMYDVLAQGLGGAVGAIGWLATGSVLTEWLRSHSRAASPTPGMGWVLEAYLLGVLVYAAMPLDLTMNPADLYRKFRDGRIALVPFSDVGVDLGSAYGVVRDALVFAPVGMWVASWRMPPGQTRPLGTCLVWGALLALGIELAQVLVYSRFSTTTDVILGALGAGVGAWITRQWWSETSSADRRVRAGSEHEAHLPARPWTGGRWLVAGVVYGLVLVVLFCGPFDVVLDDPERLRQRLEGFFSVPYARLQTGSPLNAISDVVRKLLLFGGFASLLTVSVSTAAPTAPIRRIGMALVVLVTAGLSAGIEVLQIFFPAHVPDMTDVITAGIAATLGGRITGLALRSARGLARRDQ
jgi:VanZ family protein